MEATTKVRQLRSARGLSISKLADLTKLQRRTIYAAERGEQLSAETLIKLATALEVPLADIAPETARAIQVVA